MEFSLLLPNKFKNFLHCLPLSFAVHQTFYKLPLPVWIKYDVAGEGSQRVLVAKILAPCFHLFRGFCGFL